MNYDDFIKLLKHRGEVVLIIDRGLLYWAKFVVGSLAIVSTVGFLLLAWKSKMLKKRYHNWSMTLIRQTALWIV